MTFEIDIHRGETGRVTFAVTDVAVIRWVTQARSA